jgi:cephalosporin hydroxylase
MNMHQAQTIRDFHELYYNKGVYEGGTLLQTRWMGVGTEKIPLDLWIYQEIIFELKPQLIIETGTRHGGSALFMAHMCELVGAGHVVSIDIGPDAVLPQHPRITYLSGRSSAAPDVVAEVHAMAKDKSPIMVILDSDHSARHVIAEMRAFQGLVTPGSYMIVEDSNINGHPVLPGFGPGPLEAIQEFFKENQNFEVDYAREKFLVTFNPHGYLRRKA